MLSFIIPRRFLKECKCGLWLACVNGFAGPFVSPAMQCARRLDDPLVGTTIVGAVNVLATYAVLFLMDRCGRKTLILWSSGVMFLSCVFIVLSLKGVFGNMIALVAVNVYVIFFEFG